MLRLALFAILALPLVGQEPKPSPAAGNHAVTIRWTWQNEGDPIQGFHVKRSVHPGGPYETIGTTTKLTWEDTGVDAGHTYFYVVASYNLQGESDPTPEMAFTVPSTKPRTPGRITGSAR